MTSEIIQLKELINSYKLFEEEILRLSSKIEPLLQENILNETIHFISVVNNFDTYNRCLGNNPYVSTPSNIKQVIFDNTKENICIPKRYNSFIEMYDFSKDSWFVFCHCDWEPMDDINITLKNLDKNCIYGPIGSRLIEYNSKVMRQLTGFCYERRRDGSGFRTLGKIDNKLNLADTFDCQAIIVHSSLIKKYNLKFDENLKWDLYSEDFSIFAKENYQIPSYALNYRCCHWSGYHTCMPKSYYESLEYINKKYPNSKYAGTMSIIGGKKIEEMKQKEKILFNLRNKIKKDI